MRGSAIGLVILAAAAPAAADLDRWHGEADLVVRGEVVQVAADGGAVTLVLDRALRGEPAPLALTFTPTPLPEAASPVAVAPGGLADGGGGDFAPSVDPERWTVGDRAVVFLRRVGDPEGGPRWKSLAPRSASPPAADPVAAAALDRYFGAEPAGADRGLREARAIEALGGASPALARHGAEALEALASEGALSPASVAAVLAAGRDRDPLRRVGAVRPLRGLACGGDRTAVALLDRLAADPDVEVAAMARRALAPRCGEGADAGPEAGAPPPLAVAGTLLALGLLAVGVLLVRVRGLRTGAGR